MKTKAIIGIALASAFVAGSASAHHSFAAYDMQKTVTLDGVVKDFQWINPHSQIILEGAAAGGKPGLWKIEASSPAQMGRRGWKKSNVKAGDKINIVIHPTKGGEMGGSMVKVVINGKLVGDPNAPGNE